MLSTTRFPPSTESQAHPLPNRVPAAVEYFSLKLSKLPKVESIAAASDDSRFWQPSPRDDIKEQNVQPFSSDPMLTLDDDTDADEFLIAIFGE